MIVNPNLPRVSRIAFLNPYLPGGHTQTAEIESTARLVQAAKNLSIEVKVFGSCEEIEYFDPDFVITISFQAPKLTRYPTYGLMDVPISLIGHVPRFVRNVLSYDGYMTISTSVKNWLRQLCKENNKKIHIAHSAFSVPDTSFEPGHFANATAMYIGTNWDGSRHAELFNLLSSGDYIKCYGPELKWANYPRTLYRGPIPFDGISVLKMYRESGAGLCIGHPVFDKEGIPSSRTFEIAAASALPICSDIELNQTIYGDAALYLDLSVPTIALAEQIMDHVQWIRANPSLVQEMAYQAHAIFSKQLSMEFYLNNLIEMHHKVLLENHHVAPNDSSNTTVKIHSLKGPKITYLLAVKRVDYRLYPVLKDLLQQTYNNFDIILLTQDSDMNLNNHFMGLDLKNINITTLYWNSLEENSELLNYLQNNGSVWIGILTVNDRIFPNHTSVLIKNAGEEEHNNIAGLFSGSTEFASIHLPERMIDEHMVNNTNQLRVGYTHFDTAMPLCSALLNFNLLDPNLFDQIDFFNLNSKELLDGLSKTGVWIRSCEITCSINIGYNEYRLLEGQLSQANSEKAQIVSQVSTLQQIVKSKEAELDKIYSSLSWKAACFLRKIKHVFCHYLFNARSRI